MNQQVGGSTAEPTSHQKHNRGRIAEKASTATIHTCKGGCDDEACVCKFAHKFVDLDQAPCVHKFGHSSKVLLQEHPTFINEVISHAKRFQDKPGGKTLLEILQGIERLRIERMTPFDRQRLLKRALRKSAPTLAPVLS